MAESLSSASPGGCDIVFLRGNDGNDAADVHAAHLQKIQYFYWCFPLLIAKIGID
jgi:hypothetical protein